MIILDDFLIRSKKLYEQEKIIFFSVSIIVYIFFVHLLMLPSFLADTEWETLHTILLTIWYLAAALLSAVTYGGALVVIGILFLTAEWVQMQFFTLFLPPWFFEGVWRALSFTWAVGLALLPVLAFFLYFAWEAEKEVLEKEDKENAQ